MCMHDLRTVTIARSIRYGFCSCTCPLSKQSVHVLRMASNLDINIGNSSWACILLQKRDLTASSRAKTAWCSKISSSSDDTLLFTSIVASLSVVTVPSLTVASRSVRKICVACFFFFFTNDNLIDLCSFYN